MRWRQVYLIRNYSLTERDIKDWSAGQVMFWKHLARLVTQILMRSCSISDAPFVFLTKSVTYQGWGWSPIMTRYQGNDCQGPASQGIPNHKMCHPSCSCMEAILLHSNWMQLTKIARSSYYILITSEAQRYWVWKPGISRGESYTWLMMFVAWAFFLRCDMAHLKALENSIYAEKLVSAWIVRYSTWSCSILRNKLQRNTRQVNMSNLPTIKNSHCHTIARYSKYNQ